MTGENFACADWEQRLREGRSLVPDLPLFKDKADRCPDLRQALRPDIEGQPPFAVAAGEWFRDIVRVVFWVARPTARAELFLLKRIPVILKHSLHA